MFFDLRGRRDSEEKNQFIRNLRPSPEEALKTLTRSPKTYIKEMKAFCSRFMFPSGSRLFLCNSGRGDVCVDAYGHLQPCMLLRDPEVTYDLKEGSLKDALTDFFPRMRKMEAKDPQYLIRCARCFLKGLCEQCPAKSWIEQGRLDSPVGYLCEMAHAQARYLGLLREAEDAWEVPDWEKRIKDFCSEDAL
jgi:radical SAM protein with 4Fe4S-binding SPASM domain